MAIDTKTYRSKKLIKREASAHFGRAPNFAENDFFWIKYVDIVKFL